MKKTFFLLSLTLLLNGCFQSVALLSGSAVGASSGKLVQSSLKSTISYGIKKQTGKTPLGHVLAYAEKNNPERKKETCISFIEKTRSEFCTVVKKKISLTSISLKEKTLAIIEKKPGTINALVAKKTSKPKKIYIKEEKNFIDSFIQSIKSPRKLAVIKQTKNKKNSNNNYLNQFSFGR